MADTGAIIALLDKQDAHHKSLRAIFEDGPDRWILPWAILPEVDYLASTRLGPRVQNAFLADLADGSYSVEFGDSEDLAGAARLHKRYRALKLGLVDATVMAIAERLRADAIATLDLRHFGAVEISGNPKLLPRDL